MVSFVFLGNPSFAKDGRVADFVEGELVVKFKNDQKPFRVIKLPQGKSVREARQEFELRDDVEYAEPNYIARAYFVPNDPFYSFQWHLDGPAFGGIHTEAAWDTSNGAGAVVAVIDTGVAYENYDEGRGKKYYLAPDLANTSFVPGYDFVNDDTHPNDDEGHGTHVTGTIAQSTNNSLGVAGVAFGASIMPVKVLDGNGSGTYADVASGIRWAADNGAKVINLSLGGSSPATVLEEAVAYAYTLGVTIVAAAGNDGLGVVGYPAAYDDYVIAVGATRYDETRAYYSNYGASLDLVAPGGDVTVDQNGDGYGDGVLQQTFGNRTNDWGYYFYQGTSMATPHVAGVAALVIANGNATTPDEVRSALESTADDLGASGRDDFYGQGLVNAEMALTWTQGSGPEFPTPPTSNFDVLLTQLSAPADILVSGGGPSLINEVENAPSGSVIEIVDNDTYSGGILIEDKSDIVIRAAIGASPTIDCSVIPIEMTCLELRSSADRLVKNIGIKGLTFKDARFNHSGSAATSHAIASFSGKILENIVIEDNVFDNGDSSKDESFKGSAVHLNKVDGLLVRRNTIINGALHSWTSRQEDGAITLHEFLLQPNYLNNVFIQSNDISFDYAGSNVTANTRGIVLGHIGKATERFNNVYVEDNLIDNVQKEGIKIYGVSSDPADDETTYVTSNIIKRTSNGIEIDGGTVLISRNIFDDQVSFGSEGKDEAINFDGGSVTISNTIVTNKLKGITGLPTLNCIGLFNPVSPHPTSDVEGTIYNVDPMFVSPETNDYTIGNPNFPNGCGGSDFGLISGAVSNPVESPSIEYPGKSFKKLRTKLRL